MSDELYSLTIREQTGARLLIDISDTTTSRDTGIIVSRDRISDCIRSQIDKISKDVEYEYNLCYYARYWQIQSIDNRLASDCVGSVIDWPTFDFTKPIASVLMTQPDAPYFKRVEFYFNTVKVNKY